MQIFSFNIPDWINFNNPDYMAYTVQLNVGLILICSLKAHAQSSYTGLLQGKPEIYGFGLLLNTFR